MGLAIVPRRPPPGAVNRIAAAHKQSPESNALMLLSIIAMMYQSAAQKQQDNTVLTRWGMMFVSTSLAPLTSASVSSPPSKRSILARPTTLWPVLR